MLITYKNTDTELYIDTAPGEENVVYSRIGEGVESATPALNPTVQSKHYIHMENPKSEKTGMAQQIQLSMVRVKGDAANDFIAECAEKTGLDVETSIIKNDVEANVAKKYTAIVVVNNDGTLQGGETQAMDVVLYINSAATLGTFANGTFTPTPTVP